jgi:putative nucleotidyltransferase with HDIG domain
MKNIDSLFSIVKMLSENEAVYTHGRRVARLACAIAQKMSYSDADIKHIHFAAIVHDIGKIKVPGDILNKRGALNDKEFAIIKKHPELGYHLLKDIRPESIAAEVALQHHERLDGSGYPFGLRAKDINPVTRIIAVADVIETMVSPQVYRPALSINAVLEEIKQNSGLLYDFNVVAASLLLIKKGVLSV